MPYDDQKTITAAEDIRQLKSKLRRYESELDKAGGNLQEIRTIIVKDEVKRRVTVMDVDGNPVMDGGVPKTELKTTPAVIKVPDNIRTYKVFSDSDRMKQQTDALTEYAKLKLEIDKLT